MTADTSVYRLGKLCNVLSAGAIRTRRWRERNARSRATRWRGEHPRLIRIAPVIDAWFARGLEYGPSPRQLVLLAPLMAHQSARASAVAAMSPVPQAGRTYALVGAMVAAARAALHALQPLRGPIPTTPPPGGQEKARAAVMTDEQEADTWGAAGPVEPAAPGFEPRPIGLAAWRALREPGGALYQGAAAPDPSRRDRLAVRRARVRHVRRTAYRALP